MSFIGKAVRSVLTGIGLVPKMPAMPAMPQAPTMDNSSAQTNAAAQAQLQSMMGGRTSTMLTGGAGEDETKVKTSKVLLGQ